LGWAAALDKKKEVPGADFLSAVVPRQQFGWGAEVFHQADEKKPIVALN
jgi:hypothetical protein